MTIELNNPAANALQLMAQEFVFEEAEYMEEISDEQYDTLAAVDESEYITALVESKENFNWENPEIADMLTGEINRAKRAAINIVIKKVQEGKIIPNA